MDNTGYIDVKSKANELLDQHAQGRFPVPVIDIAKALNIDVFADSSYDYKRSGHIEKNENNKLSIIVNDAQSPVRKRFTIAHEIAHTIYDMDYINEHDYSQAILK